MGRKYLSRVISNVKFVLTYFVITRLDEEYGWFCSTLDGVTSVRNGHV